MENSKISRRDFNKSAALGVASLAMSAGPLVRNVMGANDRIGIGLIGAGGMGQADLKDFLRSGQVDCFGGGRSLRAQSGYRHHDDQWRRQGIQ